MPVTGIDHRMIIARYELTLKVMKEVIPPGRRFVGWVISRDLELDSEFLEQAKFLIEQVFSESKKKSMMNRFTGLKSNQH